VGTGGDPVPLNRMEASVSAPDDKSDDVSPTICICITDPFAELPPETRPRLNPRMGCLRKVACPVCGLKYWTNRSTNLCSDCRKKDVKIR